MEWLLGIQDIGNKSLALYHHLMVFMCQFWLAHLALDQNFHWKIWIVDRQIQLATKTSIDATKFHFNTNAIVVIARIPLECEISGFKRERSSICQTSPEWQHQQCQWLSNSHNWLSSWGCSHLFMTTTTKNHKCTFKVKVEWINQCWEQNAEQSFDCNLPQVFSRSYCEVGQWWIAEFF